jgi:hypothetical protein
MHLEITKLGLQTYNLENKKPMYIHGTKTRFTKKKKLNLQRQLKYLKKKLHMQNH